MGRMTCGPMSHNEKGAVMRRGSSMLAAFVGNRIFVLEDFRLECFESNPCLCCVDAAFQLVPVVTGVVGSQVFELFHDLNS